ncbi:MAG: SMC family ATPase [Candidatus Nanohaloarchaea archaeon]|nr:SMC family ATPase [Candidatus Nanohaloarchaea archaeon]
MITRVYLKNWKSHHETELTFSPGVNALVGEMGSGKSSVLEAICFGLYGTTPAIRSSTVTLDGVIRRVPSPASEAVVEVDVRHEGATYTVRREVERDKGTTTSELRKDGELLAAPQAGEVTEEVEDLLGIDYDLFSRAIYSEQNELDYFLTLRAGERKEKIDRLLNLDRFETARSTLVSLINRLEGRMEDRKSDLQDLEEAFDEDAVEELAERVDAVEDEIQELVEEQEDVEEQLEQKEQELEALEEEQEAFEEMRERKTALKTRIETLGERVDALSDQAGEYAGMSTEALEEAQEELEQEQEQLEAQEERITELRNEVDGLEEDVEALIEERDGLEEQLERLDELEDIDEELEDAESELEAVRSEREGAKARIQEAEEVMEQLSGAADECPTCGQALTEEHRVDVLREAKEEKQELQEQVQELAEREDALAERLDDLREKRDDLVQLKGAEDRLETVEAELEETREQLDEAQDELASLQEEHPDERMDAIEEELEALDAAAEAAELAEERAERKEDLEQLEEEMAEAGFDEEELDTVREQVNELRTEQEVLANKIEDKNEVLAEREQRLAEVKEERERLEEYREAVEAYREKIDVMDDLKHGLETTQTDLRERFVTSVNDVMEQVWDRIYPYGDYTGIRLNAQEDYALELQDEEGNWISVEGEVSGGERHSSALTLRIALSIVLSPSWQVLMLDEPTHNLDATAIEDLGETLRTRVSDIVDQLFLITHEERLETAATGELYRLSKKGTGTGLTEVEEAAVE